MQAALDDAGIKAQDVQYLNAHGTSTPVGDLYEVQAIKNTFGDAAKSLKVSSTKSMTGHLLGATGGIEAIFSALSIRDSKVALQYMQSHQTKNVIWTLFECSPRLRHYLCNE